MKNLISVIWTILIIIIYNNILFCQEEAFHQITFGNEISNEQSQDYSFSNLDSKTSNINYDNILEIKADFNMAYIWIYNDSGIDIFDQIDTNYVVFSLPIGVYNIFAGYSPEINEHTCVIKESVDVTTQRLLKLSYYEAIYTNVYTFKKIDLDTLNLSTIALYFKNLLSVPNLRISHWNIDSELFIINHNSLPDHFIGEWAVKGKPFYNNNDLYLLNNNLEFFETDTVITNDINNYFYADFEYILPDSILTASSKRILTFIPDFHSSGNGDLTYTYPFIQRIYQDNSANISLHSSKFWQIVLCNQINYPNNYYIKIPEIRINNGNIKGFHFRDPIAPTFMISDTNYVKLGQMPTFWHGKFYNVVDTVKIRSPYGIWDYLFLSQTNDLLSHFPIEYTIIRDNRIIQSGFFNLLFGQPFLTGGFNPDEMTIPIQPAEYTIYIKNDFNQIGNKEGYSDVTASFNLNKTDKNPPNILSFQLLSGKEITNKFYNNSNNKIRFITEDNVFLDSVSLFYSHLNDSVKYEVQLVYNEPYFEGFLPQLTPDYYNLHTYIQDNSQNFIECNMSPAFTVDSSVLNIEESKNIAKELKLYQNYPNPFNSSTTIPFEIPNEFRGKISITVYNILGQIIKVLLEGHINNSKKSIVWNGIDKSNKQVSSGIYFIKMKGGDYQKLIKIILFR